MRSDVDDAAAVKTLAHEAAHVLLHSTAGLTGEQVCRGRREVEAESVAYLVTKAHGLDAGRYTFSYVTGWADRALHSAPEGTTLADVVTETGSRVVTAADTILQTTKPARPIDQLSTVMATQRREIHRHGSHQSDGDPGQYPTGLRFSVRPRRLCRQCRVR